jgi:hypothetical protein
VEQLVVQESLLGGQTKIQYYQKYVKKISIKKEIKIQAQSNHFKTKKISCFFQMLPCIFYKFQASNRRGRSGFMYNTDRC